MGQFRLPPYGERSRALDTLPKGLALQGCDPTMWRLVTLETGLQGSSDYFAHFERTGGKKDAVAAKMGPDGEIPGTLDSSPKQGPFTTLPTPLRGPGYLFIL